MAPRGEDDKTVRILLVSEHALLGELLKPALSNYNIKIVDHVFAPQNVLQKIKEQSPSLILINAAVYGSENEQICQQILNLYPDVKVVTCYWPCMWKWFTSQHGTQIAVRISNIGEMVQAIRTIAQGLFYSPFERQTGFSRISPREMKLKAAGLNETQMNILRLMAKGYSNRQIAQQLSLQVQTVKNNVSIIFQELGVQNRTEAVMTALRRGIISLQDMAVGSEPLAPEAHEYVA